MTSYVTPKKNAAYVFGIGLPSQASAGTFQTNPTLAAGDFKVSKDGGAFANLTNLPTVNPSGGKRVEFSLTATEMNADNVSVLCSDAAGSEWFDVVVGIQTTARQIDDLAYPATSGRSMVVDTAGLVDANTVKVGPTGSGTVQTAGDIIAGTNDLQSRVPAALVSGRMDTIVGAMAANVMTAAAADPGLTTELQTGLATAAALTTVEGKIDIIDSVVDAILVDTGTDIPALLTTIAGYLDTEIQAILADTNELQTDWANGGRLDLLLDAAASGTAPTADQNADALLDRVNGIETGFTPRQVLRLVAAVLVGKASGLGTTTAIFRDLTDAKDRVTSTVDGDGNRSSVTKDAT